LEAAVVQSQVITLSTKGQFVLPKAMRKAAGLHAGSTFTVTLEPDGTLTIRPIRGNLEPFFHSLDGFEPCGPFEVDAAIMEAVEGLDHASRKR
jgi:AbrB family looped-hinge helix DNA binding protein